MSAYDLLLIVSLSAMLFMLAAGNRAFAGWVGVAFYTAMGWLLAHMSPLVYAGAAPVVSAIGFSMGGQAVAWQLDAVGWYFAIITVGAALVVTWFGAGVWGRDYQAKGGNIRLLHTSLAMNVATMLLFLGSADMLSLFIGWELVSWSSFVLMASGGNTMKYALRYVIYAIAGAMAVMGAMAVIWHVAGSLSFTALQAAVSHMSTVSLWALVLLVFFGFGVKMAVLPFHLWQANAYAFLPGPASAFLGAISSRMGLFAMLVVLIRLLGIINLENLSILGSFSARDLLAWISLATLIIPTFIALRQYDARLLLAWHGIGQGGYMLIGVLTGAELGSAGGLMHVFNHATYQAILFLAVAAVVYRTGTADLNKMGGLVVRMPLTFLVLLFGIIGLAGLPPMNGFVSKLLVYRSLVSEGMPLLFVGTIVGTLGTVLSVFKLIHNIFLGQLRVEHEQIREVPWSMMLPMLLVAGLVFVTGVMPGLVLEWVAAVQTRLGLAPVHYVLGGVKVQDSQVDMIWITGVLFAGVGIAALIFFGLGNKSKRVHQLDNYAGGHFLTADTRYQYTDHFYAGLMHHIGSWYRGSFRWAEEAVTTALETFSILANRLVRQEVPAFSMLVVAVLFMAWIIY
ncbi:proton-conducting transporter transmembrane domain-containing protein [Thiolapillus sp.]